MKLKNLMTASLLALAPIMAQAQNLEIYVGTSSYDSQAKCQVKLTLDNQNQIIAIETEGPAKEWEITSDNPSGFGPAGNIRYESGASVLSNPDTFSSLGFVRTSLLDGYSLKSKAKDGMFKEQIKLDFKMKDSKLVAFRKSMKTSVAVVVPLATSNF
jgi:hypothetical protein